MVVVPESSSCGASQARRYSRKQLRAMRAIGLIPWIRRAGGPAPAASDQPIAGTASEVAHTRTSIPASTPAPAATPVPASDIEQTDAPACTPASSPAPDLFQGWQLRAFRHGAREMTVVGPEGAGLLILVEPINELALPLADVDQKLLRAMLQAIELKPSDIRLAGLFPQEDAPEDAPPVDGAEVGSVLSDSLRAIMILTPRPEAEFSTPVSWALAHRSLPVWFCPHPAVLRQTPEQKRDAWQILKAIRRQLGPR